jgi:hypothetical protein
MKNIASSVRIANNTKKPTRALASELMEEIKEHKIELFELMRKLELKAARHRTYGDCTARNSKPDCYLAPFNTYTRSSIGP